MASKRIVTYKCPFCDKRFNRQDLVIHVTEEHEEELPEGFTPLRYVFNYVNKKPISYHGRCTECGKDTPWDENKGRYDRQCGSKACHDSFVRKFEENMVRTRGTTRMSASAEGQKQLLAARKISGTYTFQDGGKKTYCGSYELKALQFMDQYLHIKSDDIMCPGPILEYSLDGKVHMYITDFYYQPYNLIIEVKDGGDNPNKRNMPEYRAKQIAKEKFIINETNFNYLRLTNNNMRQLLAVFMDLKMQLVDESNDRVIHVNENSAEPLKEMMNALNSGKMVGMKDCDAYIVNYSQNRVFTNDSSWGITNSIKFDNLFTIEKNKICKHENFDMSKYNHIMFKLPYNTTELNERLKPYLGKEITESEFFKIVTGNKLYTNDQILFQGLQKVKSLVQEGKEIEKLYEDYFFSDVVLNLQEVFSND